MAKQLKLNIKNAQLAKALNLNKKEEKKKPEEKPAPKRKAIRKAISKDLDTPIDQQEAAPALEEPKVEEVAAAAPPEPVEEVEKKAEEKPVRRKIDLSRIEKTRPKTGPRAAKPAPSEKPKGAPQADAPKQEEKKFSSFKDRPARLSEQKRKELRESALKRSLGQKSRFDSRDRQGLGEANDGQWRRRRHVRKRNVRRDEPIIRPTELKVRLPISVKDLAAEMKYKASELIATLFKQGIAITINDLLDDETTIQLLGEEHGCTITIDTSQEERLRITGKTIAEEISTQNEDDLIDRAPVIAFMGHVDHGKTSLIDAIRKSDLAADEAGAITQHIGAFRCNVSNGELTVLDTPGHEAFTEMRSRGATVTDVVILVVAGDEGIKPQTDEAIEQAKEAGVPIVVAINKSDKEGFDQEQIYRQLSERELLPEAWGGGTITVNCSAKTGEGIETLLELALLQAEVLELRANPKMRARGTVLESSIHHGLGNVATILVQNGTLKLNDALVFENEYGRVKTMHDEHGKKMKKAGPSQPVRITGLSGLPSAGCEFIVVDNEKEARKLAEEREAGHKKSKLVHIKQEQIDAMLLRSQQLAEKKILRIIIRADVQGSLEALEDSLAKIKSDKVELNIISSDVGQISESDIELASASNTPIIAFHTSAGPGVDDMAKKLKVQIKTHDVIYHLIDDVKALMAETLDKVRQETDSGMAEVKTTFKSSHLGVIAGCVVAEGTIKRGQFARLFRGGEQVWEGDIASLKRVKEDVKEVAKGLECGILLTNFTDIEEGDEIKSYNITYIKQEL